MKKEFYKDEIKEINEHHIRGVDKWFRMYEGFSSDLVDYKNNILHIEVRNTERKIKSDRELPVKIVGSWKNALENELKDAKGFVVYLYKTNKSTGFAVPGSDMENKEIVKDLTDKMQVEEELSLVGIFSGLID